jgi:hypothetical protein
VQVDPLRMQLPNAEPMDEVNRKKYVEYIKPYKKELDSILKVTFKN